MSTATQGRFAAGAVALVTGATRGIGRGIAERLAREGVKVIGTATSDSGAAQISDYLAVSGGTGRVLDVRDPAAVDALVASVGKEFGPIGILVNNAGVTRDTLLLRMKDADWADVIETDLSSVFRLSRAVCARHDEGPQWPHSSRSARWSARWATAGRPTMPPPRPA